MTDAARSALPIQPAYPLNNDALASRLDALELKAMDAELAQATLDAVVLQQGNEISALRAALAAATQRIDALGGQVDEPASDAAPDSRESLASALERERPPHY